MHILQALCNADYITSYLAHPPDASLARMIGFLLRCSARFPHRLTNRTERFASRLVFEAAVQPFGA